MSYYDDHMAPEEFLSRGLLHELNRQFLHPLGMALPVSKHPKTGEWIFSHIQVANRPEGIVFAEDTISPEKIEAVRKLADEKHAQRLAALGFVIQPKPGREVQLPELPDDTPDDAITDFRGPWRWLSNFHMAPVHFEGTTYPSNEHAYQAAKTRDQSQREEILLAPNCYRAKKLGQRVDLRDDWEDIKQWVMLAINREKYLRHRSVRARLLATGNRLLIEGNTWGDTYWGVCGGEGRNVLGKILMQVRAELR
jgi:ribA/ribD-fused uncharacterized protein